MELKGSFSQAYQYQREKELNEYLEQREATPEEVEDLEKEEQEAKNDS